MRIKIFRCRSWILVKWQIMCLDIMPHVSWTVSFLNTWNHVSIYNVVRRSSFAENKVTAYSNGDTEKRPMFHFRWRKMCRFSGILWLKLISREARPGNIARNLWVHFHGHISISRVFWVVFPIVFLIWKFKWMERSSWPPLQIHRNSVEGLENFFQGTNFRPRRRHTCSFSEMR